MALSSNMLKQIIHSPASVLPLVFIASATWRTIIVPEVDAAFQNPWNFLLITALMMLFTHLSRTYYKERMGAIKNQWDHLPENAKTVFQEQYDNCQRALRRITYCWCAYGVLLTIASAVIYQRVFFGGS